MNNKYIYIYISHYKRCVEKQTYKEKKQRMFKGKQHFVNIKHTFYSKWCSLSKPKTIRQHVTRHSWFCYLFEAVTIGYNY